MKLLRLYAGLLLALPGAAAVLHVNSRAAAGGDGRSWPRALADLSAALKRARAGDSIWVVEGTYYPTAGADRESSFELRAGVAVYGGFAGTETVLAARDPGRHITVLSGDIGRRGVAEDNVYHVVRGATGAMLDGFTVRDGYAVAAGPPERGSAPPGRLPGPPIHVTPREVLRGAGPGAGGGLLNYQAAPTVRNCVFENNQAAKGGAVYNMTSTSFPPHPAGGAVPVFVNCTFRKNRAVARGAGVSNDLGTSPVFLNCVFEENETEQKGGGMYNDFGSSPVLINCLFRGNRAEIAGAIGNDGASAPVLLHCTLEKNHARDMGPALYQGTGPANNPVVLRSVVRGNTCDWEGTGIYNWHDNTPRVEESVIEGGYPGVTAADAAAVGYRPGDARFLEARLGELLRKLRPYRAAAPRPAAPAGPPAAVPGSTRVVYVNAARKGPGDGKTWATAHGSLHAAIEDAARDGAEVWVAAGTYKPSAAERAVSFVLRPGVKLYGGFQGTESARHERDAARHITVLSGEIGDPLLPEDNSYHVLVGAGGAVVDGFTITAGYADAMGYDGKGGGLINYRRAPQDRPNAPTVTGYSTEVRNSIFLRNYARDGGAVYSYDRGRPRFVRVTFRDNRAENGGAVVDRVGVEAVYEDCEFTGNSSRWRGGAAYFDYGARPSFTGTRWRGNFTKGHGGAIYSLSRASQLENTLLRLMRCRFENNTASGDGGALALDDNSVARVEDCVFVSNRALGHGGAAAVTRRSQLEASRVRFAGNSSGSGPADVFRDERRVVRLNQ